MDETFDQRYQTGAVDPPKGHSGLVAVLLIAVILLAGSCAMMGAVNLRLFRALRQSNSDLSVYTREASPDLDAQMEGTVSAALEGDEITPMCQNYYGLPAGIYINQDADEDTDQGIRRGDILLSVAGCRITTWEDLAGALDAYQPGDQVVVTVLRQDREISLILVVEDDQ